MLHTLTSPLGRRFLMLAAMTAPLGLGACGTVIAAADTAGTIAVGAVGLAADAAIGTVKVAGKVVGHAADAVVDGGSSTH